MSNADFCLTLTLRYVSKNSHRSMYIYMYTYVARYYAHSNDQKNQSFAWNRRDSFGAEATISSGKPTHIFVTLFLPVFPTVLLTPLFICRSSRACVSKQFLDIFCAVSLETMLLLLLRLCYYTDRLKLLLLDSFPRRWPKFQRNHAVI